MKKLILIIMFLTLGACNAQAAWQQHGGPVLSPTLAWEGRAVQEPTVIWDHGRYRMWYTAGWLTPFIGYAESRDGIHWRKRARPIWHDAAHSNVIRYGGRFYFFAVNHAGDIKAGISQDGVHIRYVGIVLRPRPSMWDATAYGNNYEWHDKRGWHVLYEGGVRNQFPWGTWQETVVSTRDILKPWPHAPRPIFALQVGDGCWGGPWMDGHVLYYHASTGPDSLPTDIYASRTSDLRHWSKPRLVLRRSQPWEVDQVADPSIARAPGRRPLMAFSGMDNPHQRGAIGVAFER